MLITGEEHKKWVNDNPKKAKLIGELFKGLKESHFEEFNFENEVDEWEIMRAYKYTWNGRFSKFIVILRSIQFGVWRIGMMVDNYKSSEIPKSWGETLVKSIPKELTIFDKKTFDEFSITNT